MKKKYFYLLLILSFYKCSDNDEKVIKIYNRAHEYYLTSEIIDTAEIDDKTKLIIFKHSKKDYLKKSLQLFEKIEDEYPNFPQRTIVLLNIALITKKNGNFEKSIKYCNKVLKSKTTIDSLKSNDILYKRLANFYLSEIYLKKNDYSNSIKYLNNIQKYSDNEVPNNITLNTKISIQYAKIYKSKGNFKKAIDYILPYILFDKLNQETELSSMVVELITKTYSKNEIENELKNVVRPQTNNTTDLIIFKRKLIIPNIDYYIVFKDTEHPNKLTEIEKGKKLFKMTKFYSVLNKKSP